MVIGINKRAVKSGIVLADQLAVFTVIVFIRIALAVYDLGDISAAVIDKGISALRAAVHPALILR